MSVAVSNYCLRRGKRVSADSISPLFEMPHLNFKSYARRKRKPASLNGKRDMCREYPEERAPENALLHGIYDDTAPNFGYRYSCRCGNGKYARMQTMRVRDFVGVWDVRASTFSQRTAQQPAHQIPTLLILPRILLLSTPTFPTSHFPFSALPLSVENNNGRTNAGVKRRKRIETRRALGKN